MILTTKIILNLQLRPKRIPSKDLWPKLKGTNKFNWIEIVLIWQILLNPRFETQVTLIASYFLKKITNYFIIAWYFCQKVLHNSFIYEAFWDIKVSFLHWIKGLNVCTYVCTHFDLFCYGKEACSKHCNFLDRRDLVGIICQILKASLLYVWIFHYPFFFLYYFAIHIRNLFHSLQQNQFCLI